MNRRNVVVGLLCLGCFILAVKTRPPTFTAQMDIARNYKEKVGSQGKAAIAKVKETLPDFPTENLQNAVTAAERVCDDVEGYIRRAYTEDPVKTALAILHVFVVWLVDFLLDVARAAAHLIVAVIFKFLIAFSHELPILVSKLSKIFAAAAPVAAKVLSVTMAAEPIFLNGGILMMLLKICTTRPHTLNALFTVGSIAASSFSKIVQTLWIWLA
ncbi:unnamed protein product [Symbiodinium microadriaticum]|nr:unnamed protein product [Symbiodinium microadriaticum]